MENSIIKFHYSILKADVVLNQIVTYMDDENNESLISCVVKINDKTCIDDFYERVNPRGELVNTMYDTLRAQLEKELSILEGAERPITAIDLMTEIRKHLQDYVNSKNFRHPIQFEFGYNSNDNECIIYADDGLDLYTRVHIEYFGSYVNNPKFEEFLPKLRVFITDKIEMIFHDQCIAKQSLHQHLEEFSKHLLDINLASLEYAERVELEKFDEQRDEQYPVLDQIDY